MGKVQGAILCFSSFWLLNCGGLESIVRSESSSNGICDTEAESVFQSGTGTPSDPYIICTADQLMMINSSNDFLASSFKVAANIDLSTNNSFVPIGIRDNLVLILARPFSGHFDGDGHTISGYRYQATSTTLSAGFFGYAKGATITRLNLTGGDIKGARHSALLVGFGENLNISQVSVQGRVAPRDSEVANLQCGGLLGELTIDQPGTQFKIEDINIDLELSANDACGGLYGWITMLTNSTSLEISNVNSSGAYSQSTSGNSLGSVGGYVDLNASNVTLAMRDIHRTGDFTIGLGGGSFSGGLFGQFQIRGNAVQFSVENASMNGNFSTRSDFNLGGAVGGFVGNIGYTAANSSMEFKKIAIDGNVRILATSIGNNNALGGLIGQVTNNGNTSSQLLIENSYFNGELASENANTLNHVGGIIGHLQGGAGSPNVMVRTSYVNLTASLAALTVTNRLALIGRYSGVVTSDFLDVYYKAPAEFVGGSGQAEPSNNPEVVELDATQILQSSSFIGAGWDFVNIWQASDGVRSPFLR